MKNFQVTIKGIVFEKPNMSFLSKKGFIPDRGYTVVSSLGNKILIKGDNGELVDLFPSDCVFKGFIN